MPGQWKPAKEKRLIMDEIEARSGLICHWCKWRVQRVPKGYVGPLSRFHATLDHIVPRCRGGGDNIENLVIACNHCNNLRSVVDASGSRTAKRRRRILRRLHARGMIQ